MRSTQSRSSLGILPPLAAIFASTVLCSHMFIFAESPIRSAGQPSSVASSLRASRLLSISRSFSRSTMEVRQFSFCGCGGGLRLVAADAEFRENFAEKSHGSLLCGLVGRHDPARLHGHTVFTVAKINWAIGRPNFGVSSEPTSPLQLRKRGRHGTTHRRCSRRTVRFAARRFALRARVARARPMACTWRAKSPRVRRRR